MINYDVQIIVSFIFGLLGLYVFLFHLTRLFAKEKDKTKLSVRIGLLLVFGCFALLGAYSVYQWSDFKNHTKKTTGTTIQIKTYAKGATQIEYEYRVNGKRYVGESTYYPADLKKIKIPGGKFPVFYNENKPKVSEMDFSKVPKNSWQ